MHSSQNNLRKALIGMHLCKQRVNKKETSLPDSYTLSMSGYKRTHVCMYDPLHKLCEVLVVCLIFVLSSNPYAIC